MKEVKNGWIALPREITESDLWVSEVMTRGQAWADLWALAAWRSDIRSGPRGTIIRQDPGTVVKSLSDLSGRWNWNKQRVRRFLKQLQAIGEITLQSNNVTTCIHLTKYEQYNPRCNANKNANKLNNKHAEDIENTQAVQGQNASRSKRLNSFSKNLSNKYQEQQTTQKHDAVCGNDQRDLVDQIVGENKYKIKDINAYRAELLRRAEKNELIVAADTKCECEFDLSSVVIPEKMELSKSVFNYLAKHCSYLTAHSMRVIATFISFDELQDAYVKSTKCEKMTERRAELVKIFQSLVSAKLRLSRPQKETSA